jgi:hypothetical protein
MEKGGRQRQILSPTAQAHGAQPAAENGGIPGLFRADRRAERLSAYGMLAEGEVLSSNPLRFVFNKLQNTWIFVDVV